MNKIILMIIAFMLITLATEAQSNELIIGKWLFKDAYNKENIDEAGLQMLKTDVINKMTFNFKDNSSFDAYLMGEITEGTWFLTENSKEIILKTSDGPMALQILKLTKSELALKLGLGEFLMKKAKN